MRKFACALCALVSMCATVFGQTKLEIRLAEGTPGVGLTEAAMRDSDRRVYLHDGNVIGNADVVAARVVADGARFYIGISLTPGGAARMESATGSHQGRPLAILVNGSVVSAPIVRGVIRQDAMIYGTFTRQEADEIVAGLIGK